jgi:hypothetical protein
MSHILKIEYDLTLTLTALLPPPTPQCCQACRHRPQGCGHAAALAAGAPSAAAVLAPHCPLRFLRCRRCCAAAAATTLPPPQCRRHHAATAAALPPPLRCRRRRTAATALPAAMLPLRCPPHFRCRQSRAVPKLPLMPPPPPRPPLHCCAAAAATAVLPPPPNCRC